MTTFAELAHAYATDADSPYRGVEHAGRMTSDELEPVRKVQEIAWYRAGYTRQQIATFLRGWPEIFGHEPNEWSVGDLPEDVRGSR